MPHPDYRTCWRCGRHKDECGPLSWTRLCKSCALEVSEENIRGIAEKQGPSYKRWRGGMIRYADKLLAERLQTRS